jgi:hypothetical protein
MNDSDTEFTSFSNEYEARQIASKMSDILFNKDSHPHWINELADLFVEYGDVMGLTSEQLNAEVHDVCSGMTDADIISAIDEYSNEN